MCVEFVLLVLRSSVNVLHVEENKAQFIFTCAILKNDSFFIFPINLTLLFTNYPYKLFT